MRVFGLVIICMFVIVSSGFCVVKQVNMSPDYSQVKVQKIFYFEDKEIDDKAKIVYINKKYRDFEFDYDKDSRYEDKFEDYKKVRDLSVSYTIIDINSKYGILGKYQKSEYQNYREDNYRSNRNMIRLFESSGLKFRSSKNRERNDFS